MASINLGVVGCIAASAAGSPPTAVSIAENASSGQNNAFKTVESAGIESTFDVNYSDWTSATSESFGTQYEISASAGDLGDWDDAGKLLIYAFAYLRATGATSYAWSGSVYSHNFGSGSGDPTASISGVGATSQDATGGLFGTGVGFTITPGSGRGGALNWPTNGDYVIFKLTGTATNSDGSTTADLYLRISFTG